MSEYRFHTDSITNNEKEFKQLLRFARMQAESFIVFSNNFINHEEHYNGCHIELYELDGDEDRNGEEYIKWLITFNANYDEEISYSIRGYSLSDKATLYDWHGNIMIESIGHWSAEIIRWNAYIDNILEKDMTPEDFDDKYNIVQKEIDLYELWTEDMDLKIKFKPDIYTV